MRRAPRDCAVKATNNYCNYNLPIYQSRLITV
nr:MAG TPA_asm: hypothetical protein [Caudoviricetes sp.]